MEAVESRHSSPDGPMITDRSAKSKDIPQKSRDYLRNGQTADETAHFHAGQRLCVPADASVGNSPSEQPACGRRTRDATPRHVATCRRLRFVLCPRHRAGVYFLSSAATARTSTSSGDTCRKRFDELAISACRTMLAASRGCAWPRLRLIIGQLVCGSALAQRRSAVARTASRKATRRRRPRAKDIGQDWVRMQVRLPTASCWQCKRPSCATRGREVDRQARHDARCRSI